MPLSSAEFSTYTLDRIDSLTLKGNCTIVGKYMSAQNQSVGVNIWEKPMQRVHICPVLQNHWVGLGQYIISQIMTNPHFLWSTLPFQLAGMILMQSTLQRTLTEKEAAEGTNHFKSLLLCIQNLGQFLKKSLCPLYCCFLFLFQLFNALLIAWKARTSQHSEMNSIYLNHICTEVCGTIFKKPITTIIIYCHLYI